MLGWNDLEAYAKNDVDSTYLKDVAYKKTARYLEPFDGATAMDCERALRRHITAQTNLQLIMRLRHLPPNWMLICSFCDFENDEDWRICAKCKNTNDKHI